MLDDPFRRLLSEDTFQIRRLRNSQDFAEPARFERKRAGRRRQKEFAMCNLTLKQLSAFLVLIALALGTISCRAFASNEEFFGKNEPPAQDVLRYITGDEPESLDPQLSSGQPESRIFMALYEGLVEYDRKNLDPVPAIAERWDENNDSSEFVFHLRKNARWSNGDPITARDFVYSLRRGLAPELTSRSASLAYYIRYAESYNQGEVFVWDAKAKQFLLEKDFTPPTNTLPPLSQIPLGAANKEYKPTAEEPTRDADTPFHRFMHSPARLTLPGDEKARQAALAGDPKLQAATAGKEFVKVKGEDIGVEAVDDYTLRLSLRQSTPFFSGLLANPFFRLVPEKAIEQYHGQWTNPSHIVTCGPFKMKLWKPYSELAVVRDPMYWDAANVHLDEIRFYPIADQPTMMNLYKVGEVDALGNHFPPNAWLDVVRWKKDYMEAPEAAVIYIVINTTKPPMNDLRVRKAFDLAIDKGNWIKWRKIVKPLTAITPEGIFNGYPEAKGSSFDPAKARQLLADAGFSVSQNKDGSFVCPSFP